MQLKGTFLSLLAITPLALAIPTPNWNPLRALTRRQSAISSSQISVFQPYAYFASAAYCTPSQTAAWNCGNNCDAQSDFIPVASGGDGTDVQYWYVGYSPSLSTAIVAHQGTNPSSIEADGTDADAVRINLDSGLFPGIDSSITVHRGFADTQADTATSVLAAVQQVMSTYGTSQVTIVGHSLGAALALLDSVYLPIWIPNASFQVITFGMPRVGNQAFANYIDANWGVTHINNMEDPVPTVPGMFLGYHHPSGEIHIMDNGQWVSCPGQDNSSTECIVGDVPNVTDGNVSNHDGPYDGVTMGC